VAFELGTHRLLDRPRCRAHRCHSGACFSPSDIVKEAANTFPDQQIVLTGEYGSHGADGWHERKVPLRLQRPQAFENGYFAAIIVTDIDANIGDTEDSVADHATR
jgi:phosphoribosylformimino-5-aminoimidazole carboxamide ribonucleotide (ProFAR) isomerase